MKLVQCPIVDIIDTNRRLKSYIDDILKSQCAVSYQLCQTIKASLTTNPKYEYPEILNYSQGSQFTIRSRQGIGPRLVFTVMVRQEDNVWA